MYRWTALVAGLVCIFFAPLLRVYVPDLIDPWLLRTIVGSGYLGAVFLSFISPWARQNLRLMMVGLTYAITAWLILLNYLNNFTPPLAYAIFELLVGGSIAFISLRYLSIYLSLTCIAVAYLLQQVTVVDLHNEVYLSSLAVVALLVLLVNYWRSNLMQEAQETGLLMQSVFSNSADGLVLLKGGIVTEASAKSLAMLNADNESSLQNKLSYYIDNRAAYQNSSQDFHLRNDEGLNLWVEIVVTHAGAKDLELMRLTDISARKQAELELTQAATTAESALRARRDFLTTISHELRTPLNGVIGASRLLATDHVQGTGAELVSIIERSGSTLLASIDNIIAFAEMDSGDLALREEPLSIQSCVQQAIKTVQDQADQKQLPLHVEFYNLDQQLRTGDSIRLTQILEQLLDNAIKFTKQGSVRLRVSGDDEGHAGLLTFELVDTGLGIEPELRDQIFDSFTQADASDAREHGGIGLGLAICSRLVNRLGGRLTCQSELAQGSTFSFTIPLPLASQTTTEAVSPSKALDSEITTQQEPSRRKLASAAAEEPESSRATNACVLLVEDNEMNQKITLRMLSKLGYQADLAEDGEQAIIACQNKRYDLILMDLQMPNMGGLEATAALRAKVATQLTPIIALTANAQASDRERCLSAGMNDFLAKPAKLAVLEERLSQHLEV